MYFNYKLNHRFKFGDKVILVEDPTPDFMLVLGTSKRRVFCQCKDGRTREIESHKLEHWLPSIMDEV